MPSLVDGRRRDGEAELLERLRKMDSAVWGRVMRQYRPGILYACWRRVRNRADAEDLCSQVFVRAVSQIGRFRGDASLKTWLHTIAYNLCMTHLAAARPSRHTDLDRIAAGDTRRGAVASDAPSADRQIASAQLRSAFDRAMATLDPELSNAFHLREIEGLSYDEIAGVTGVSINTVKTRIFRARLHLRTLLVEHRG